MEKRKPEVTKVTVPCRHCKGQEKKGCRQCDNGLYTSHYIIVDSKGNGIIADTLK